MAVLLHISTVQSTHPLKVFILLHTEASGQHLPSHIKQANSLLKIRYMTSISLQSKYFFRGILDKIQQYALCRFCILNNDVLVIYVTGHDTISFVVDGFNNRFS